MKKLLAALMACTVITFAFASCGDSDSKESSGDISSSSEESDDASFSGTPSASAQDLIGDWYSDEIEGYFCFREDGAFNLKIDISEIMTIDEKGVVHMPDEDNDFSEYCTYDGETFSFAVGEGDEVFDMMTMKRKDGVNKDSAFGEYYIVSGYLFEEIAEEFVDTGDKYGIIVGDGLLAADIAICSYTVSGNEVILSGDGLSYFGIEDDEDSSFEFEINGDELTLTSEGESLVMTRG